jgi:phage terminase large subunit-like protein
VKIQKHQSYLYAQKVCWGEIIAPRYVKKQCSIFLDTADNKSEKYCVNSETVELIDSILKLLIMPRGLKAGKTVHEALAEFQFFLIVAVLCTVYKKDKKHRRYETAILEICRKNGKTFLVAVIFIILFFTEPKFSKFYSVAPDGSLSREVQTAIREIIQSSPALDGKFKIRRDDILCLINQNDYIPLNFSTSRLDGRLPNVFLADEVGAMTSNYPIEAMRSGQLTILNKLGCIISTKYPTINNPFEDEVSYAKKIFDGIIEDETVFALLYEPDNPKEWETDDKILMHGNPLALVVPEIMDDLKKKRTAAIESPLKRENFLTKHCNIIYQGIGTETYIPVADVQKCKVDKIDWSGRRVYLGVDLAQTTDNCAVAMVSLDDYGNILADVVAFVPEGRIEAKNRMEKIDYREFIEAGKCIACGDNVVNYAVIEQYVFSIEKEYDVEVCGIGYDRFNAMSSAQKWEQKYTNLTVEVKQHSSVLHPATKLLREKIIDGQFQYEENKLLEINFQNAKCVEDTNKNKYVNKKKSNGKVDMVVALINAVYLLNEFEILSDISWSVQF